MRATGSRAESQVRMWSPASGLGLSPRECWHPDCTPARQGPAIPTAESGIGPRRPLPGQVALIRRGPFSGEGDSCELSAAGTQSSSGKGRWPGKGDPGRTLAVPASGQTNGRKGRIHPYSF